MKEREREREKEIKIDRYREGVKKLYNEGKSYLIVLLGTYPIDDPVSE